MKLGCAALAVVGLLAGCMGPPIPPPNTGTPPSTTVLPSPSVTTSPPVGPSPTPTGPADQQAAIRAVEGFTRVSSTIAMDPAHYSEADMTRMLSEFIGGEMIPANVNSFLLLKKKGYRWSGPTVAVWSKASGVSDGGGTRGHQILVSVCQDQRAKVVNKAGDPVPDAGAPDFQIRQYSVRMPSSSSQWRVYGMETVKGSCP